MSNKVVVNSCYGGFSLSIKAQNRLIELGAKGTDSYGCRDICRHDPLLIQVIEEMGEGANGSCAHLEVEEIEGRLYSIDEYDGMESVVEPDDQVWICID